MAGLALDPSQDCWAFPSNLIFLGDASSFEDIVCLLVSISRTPVVIVLAVVSATGGVVGASCDP